MKHLGKKEKRNFLFLGISLLTVDTQWVCVDTIIVYEAECLLLYLAL